MMKATARHNSIYQKSNKETGNLNSTKTQKIKVKGWYKKGKYNTTSQ